MKVTAFIRKTAAKNNVTDQARVYFRVRDVGGVDIKAASELSINPRATSPVSHWCRRKNGWALKKTSKTLRTLLPRNTIVE